MAVRVYACPIVGTGTADDLYRPLIEGMAGVTATSNCIANNPDGTPLRNWTILRVEASDWTTVDANAQCILLADSLADLAGPIPAAIQTKLVARNIATAGQLAGLTLRDLLRFLVRRHYLASDEVVALKVGAGGVA